MKLDALDHPKTLDFAARLNVTLPQAIGHLELLWAFVAQKTPQGNIGKWPNGAIARSAYWDGDPDEFVFAAIDAGFIDRSKEYRLVVHDWQEHMPNWVRAKLKKSGLPIAKIEDEVSRDTSNPENPDLSGDLSSDVSTDLSEDSHSDSYPDSVREGKGREEKGSNNPPESPPDEIADLERKTNFSTFLQNCESAGIDPIPPEDPIFDYAQTAGIPRDYLKLCWHEFHDKYLEKPRKYQAGVKGWRATFRNCVRDNWYGIWAVNGDGEYFLTSKGKQAENYQRNAA